MDVDVLVVAVDALARVIRAVVVSTAKRVVAVVCIQR